MKTHRLISAAIALLLTSTYAFAVNDFWLGSRFSVGVSFSVKHEAFVDPPKMKALSMPSYPLELLGAGVQGRARIQFLVREDGTVTDVSVVNADNDSLGVEAKKTVAGWAFVPAKNSKSEKRVVVQMQCEFEFKMDEKPSANAAEARPE